MPTVQINLTTKPHAAQQAVLDSDARFKVLMCGRRFGKSLIAQVQALMTLIEGKRVAYITPTYLLAKSFFLELDKNLPPTVKRNASDLTIEMNGGLMRFFTGERMDNLRGMKFHLVIVDEASYISDLESGWLNSIRPTLTDYKGKALFLSTPRGRNYFYSLYLKGQNGDPEWASWKFTTHDNPYIDPQEIEAARTAIPEAVYRQEYLADPQENAANPFGAAYIRQCCFPISGDSPIVFGIDLAKSHDYTVVVGLDRNGSVCHLDRFQRDWRSTRNHIGGLAKVPITIDSTGVGDPIHEDLASMGYDIEGFKFTSTSKQQLMEGLANAIHQRKITFPEGIITQELEVFEYQYTANGVRYSAPSGFHDDAVMALALAWYKWGKSKGHGVYSFI
jgi:hypothetical protein